MSLLVKAVVVNRHFLNILGGLDNEYQGMIEIDGQDIRQIPHYIRKYIGFIFQQFYLIEEMNVKEKCKSHFVF